MTSTKTPVATVQVELLDDRTGVDVWSAYGEPITPVRAVTFLTGSARAQLRTDGRWFRVVNVDDRAPRSLDSLRAEVRGWF